MTPGTRLVCEAWCSSVEVLGCPPCGGLVVDAAVMTDAIDAASDIMFFLAGRQFPGVCSDTVFPNRPEFYGTGVIGSESISTGEVFGRVSSRNEYADDRNLGAGAVSAIRLPGYPVVAISSVKIDGVVLAASAYKILDDRWLLRVDGQYWPIYQDLTKPDTGPPTFEVVYTFGVAIPAMARRAAAAYACQIVKACSTDSSACSLPEKTQSIVRSGLSVRKLSTVDYIENGKTGVDAADAFLRAVNPKMLQENAVILSPDTDWPAHRLR